MSEDKFRRENGRDWNPGYEHPENDLTREADQSIPPRPAPRSFDELADSVDPVAQEERNRRSGRQAVVWLFGIPVLTFVLAGVLGLVFRLIGGPLCDAGEATWLCSRAAQIWWPVLTSIVPVVGVLGCAAIIVHKLRTYTRWRIWMGVFWVMVPFSMLWMTTVIPIAMAGADFF